MNKKNKKYIIWFVGIIIFLFIFIGIMMLQQNPRQQQVTPNSSPTPVQTDQSSFEAPPISLTPLSNSATTATQQFYNYYFATDKDPLANGAYKSNPYLSSDFKEVLGKLYRSASPLSRLLISEIA